MKVGIVGAGQVRTACLLSLVMLGSASETQHRDATVKEQVHGTSPQ